MRHQITHVVELPHMCDLPRRLESELEIRRDRACPSLQGRNFGDAIKRAVDLDRLKALAVNTEHLLCWQVLGIERALPWLVGVAAGANVEAHLSFPRRKVEPADG